MTSTWRTTRSRLAAMIALVAATTAAVVMTMEPVFAALIAASIGGETLHATAWLGGVVVVSSMFAELGPRKFCDAQAPRVECC